MKNQEYNLKKEMKNNWNKMRNSLPEMKNNQE